MAPKTFILKKTENLDKLSCHSHDPDVLKLIFKLKNRGILLNKLLKRITYGAGKWELKTTDYVPEDYPNASFVMDPTEPKISEEITFTDTSTQGSSPINVWSWDFGDLSPATSTQNPFYIYYEVEPITVELTITDSDPSGGRSCSTSTLFNVRPGKPEYIEVIPR